MEALQSIPAMSMIIALATVGLNLAVRAYRGDQAWASRGKITVDLLNGTVLVPFFVLSICVFSDGLLQELTKNDKLILSVAGAIGLFFVIGEIVKTEQPTKNNSVANTPSTGAKLDASKPHS
jgi:hypothetical protein